MDFGFGMDKNLWQCRHHQTRYSRADDSSPAQVYRSTISLFRKSKGHSHRIGRTVCDAVKTGHTLGFHIVLERAPFVCAVIGTGVAGYAFIGGFQVKQREPGHQAVQCTQRTEVIAKEPPFVQVHHQQTEKKQAQNH